MYAKTTFFTFYKMLRLCYNVFGLIWIMAVCRYCKITISMETKYLQFNEKDLAVAGELIRAGELVAFPTETVYGLGANALNVQAVKSTYVAKGRPSDNPLIVHVWNKSQIYYIAREVSSDAEKVIRELMPDSITIVLPKRDIINDCITAGLDTVAIRMPKSHQARDFLQAANVPVTAPSANISGRPSPTTWQRVKEDMDGKIAAILRGEPCNVGIESTVLDLSREEPLILRPGIVTCDVISEVLNKPVRVVSNPREKVNSPGVRYKHYAPKVPMALDLNGDTDKLCKLYDELVSKGHNPVLLVENVEAYCGRNTVCIGRNDLEVSQNLFENLRKLEERYTYILASFSSKTDFAYSIINRLTRSAGGNII